MIAMSAGSIASAALVAFGLMEFLLREGASARSWHATAADRGSTAAIVAAYAVVCVALTVRVGGPRFAASVQWFGASLAIAGVVLRIVAFRTLGASYSRTLRVTEQQALVTRGVYRRVRHPGYASAILIWGGAAIASGVVAAAAVAGVVLVGVYLYRIGAEERMLARAFGAEYEAYRARSWRLVPYVY
jgi:protein-S-isoprenylcysteine O-methyltransferase Ste14